MRVNLPEDGCTGCGDCDNVCPQAVIKMKESGEGFLYPAIDEETCVGCGLCAKICPVNHPDYSASDKPDFYAAMAMTICGGKVRPAPCFRCWQKPSFVPAVPLPALLSPMMCAVWNMWWLIMKKTS